MVSVAPAALPAAAGPKGPRNASLSRHIKFPTFDGTENVESFVRMFERTCDFLDADDISRLVLL